MKSIWESMVGKIMSVLKTIRLQMKRWISHVWLTSPRACMVYLVVISGISSALIYYSFNISDQQGSSLHHSESQQKVLEILRSQLENRLTTTEAYLQRLEEKVVSVGKKLENLGNIDQLGALEAHNAPVGDVENVIKQEVAQQLGSLKKEIKEEQQKQKRKVVLQRFLEQLSNEED